MVLLVQMDLGKSTTIRTLLGLIYANSGEATIFGKDYLKNSSEIAQNIGYLPSEVFYYENMKVIDLLKYSASFYKKDCMKKIKELAKFMELDLNKKIDKLSFGNKKKVGIVQGLLHEPKLIVLDEPTSGLDPLMQQKFFHLLELENKKGSTILFSSHILSEIQRMCTRVAIIKEGRIIKVDTVSNLRDDNYKKFKIELKNNININDFKFKGINNIEINKNIISFLFKGNLKEILSKLVTMDLINLLIEEPSLEEIFMHYYK